jgi:hypothetical protein
MEGHKVDIIVAESVEESAFFYLLHLAHNGSMGC